MASFSIVLVEDEDSQRYALKGFLVKKGYEVNDFADYDSADDYISSNYFDFVLTDFKIKDRTGLEILQRVKEINPNIPVVVMTAYGTIEDAVNLVKQGLFDYVQKPINLPELLHIIENASERQSLISENKTLKNELRKKYSFDSIITGGGEMEEALNTAARVARSKAGVLIRGESGVGKELIAKAIHVASERRDKPFIAVNCAALPETLFESELFGHEKGSFTGAHRQRIGKFEQAEGGSLFIDEVGDMPLAIQVKILRTIQLGEFERLGGEKTIKGDVRIITATNRNLEEMIRNGAFREDLYYRFNVVTINVPPLRRRKNDVAPLADFFIKKYSEQSGIHISGISKEAMDALVRYDFPGNVRELENIIQRAVALSRDEHITLKDLPVFVVNPVKECPANQFDDCEVGDLNEAVERLEKNMISKALDLTGGNQSKAGEILNLSERTLRYKIAKYGIKNR